MVFNFNHTAVFFAVGLFFSTGVFAAVDYPKQEFRFGIADTDRNITILKAEEGSTLTSSKIQGTLDEKWTLNYISAGVYEIVNSKTGLLVTSENGVAKLLKDTDAANQRWKIESVQKDFDGYSLYYKVVSNADSKVGLTFDVNSNSLKVATYSGDNYQKFKLNLDGLEGYAANANTPNGEKAGTIGGLLGDVVVVTTDTDLVEELKKTEPKTVVVCADIDMQKHSHTRLRDNKTLVGCYGSHTLYDPFFRTNNEYGTEGDEPSDNIIFRNLKMVAKNQPNRILINVWSSRQIWIDHIYFESQLTYDRKGNGQDEVGKFIWINTPYMTYMDKKDNGRSPDYVTISYSRFKNRYWTVAYGTQNTELTRDRTTLLYNWWDKNVRRCPQLGNGSAHIYNNYFSAYGKSDNGGATTGIIGGEGSDMVSIANRFNGYTQGQALTMGGGVEPARDEYSYLSEALDGTPARISFTPKTTSSWKPEQTNYGYSLMDAYNTKGSDVKDFCTKYAGDQTNATGMKYITDSDLKNWVTVVHPAPFLKSIQVGSEPVEEIKPKVATVIDTSKFFSLKNMNSGFFLATAATAELKSGTDVVQSENEMGWKWNAEKDGYYTLSLVDEYGDATGLALDLEGGSPGNGTNVAVKELAKDSAAKTAQLFKFVKNQDDSYTMVMQVSVDQSCVGIGTASKESGASSIEWACDGTSNQNWALLEWTPKEKPEDSITAIARHHLEFSATSFMSVTVFDLNGNRLAHFNNLKTFENIQDRVRNLLPQGAYILRIQNETFNKTQFLKIR
jgi:pectin lyase